MPLQVNRGAAEWPIVLSGHGAVKIVVIPTILTSER
ncbi:MAG: hypothetical protein ACI9BK_003556 [Acidimicrobiales bacterium]|jgi:hypothetical protein